jgi:phosphatidate cytidylyltransferase
VTLSNGQKNFFLRALSGTAVVLGILGAVQRGDWLWVLLVAALALVSLSEYYRLLSARFHVSRGIGYLSALAVLFAFAEGVSPVSVVLILSLTVYVVFMVEIARRQAKGVSRAVENAGGVLSGILFIVVPWACLLLLDGLPMGKLVLVSLFACTWSSDVTAYLVGSRWGRTVLCETISPNKTWEGFIGGALGSFLMIGLIVFYREQPPFPLFLIGAICALAGQLGDLAESLVKREMGAKDAGKLIPGHGGVLDRFDSILINGLLTYLLFGIVLP